MFTGEAKIYTDVYISRESGEERLAQQESGAALSKNSVFTGEAKIYTDVYISRESGEERLAQQEFGAELSNSSTYRQYGSTVTAVRMYVSGLLCALIIVH